MTFFRCPCDTWWWRLMQQDQQEVAVRCERTAKTSLRAGYGLWQILCRRFVWQLHSEGFRLASGQHWSSIMLLLSYLCPDVFFFAFFCWPGFGRYNLPSINAGWWFQPLWKIWKSVWIIIPKLWKNKIHVPNHQPECHESNIIKDFATWDISSMWPPHVCRWSFHPNVL